MPYGPGHPDVEMSGEDFVYNGEQLKKQKKVLCGSRDFLLQRKYCMWENVGEVIQLWIS